MPSLKKIHFISISLITLVFFLASVFAEDKKNFFENGIIYFANDSGSVRVVQFMKKEVEDPITSWVTDNDGKIDLDWLKDNHLTYKSPMPIVLTDPKSILESSGNAEERLLEFEENKHIETVKSLPSGPKFIIK